MKKRLAEGRLRRTDIVLAITLCVLIPALVPLIFALAGNFSYTSPVSCGANCSGSYELSGHNESYCLENPIECFNTIDECKDGDEAIYEYVENVTVTSLNGSDFSSGDTITIDAYVDCDMEGDTISFIYSNGSGFRILNEVECYENDKIHIYYNHTLDKIEGNHTVRIMSHYPIETGFTCGEQSPWPKWTDHDDVSFYVGAATDSQPPMVYNPTPEDETIFEKQENLEVLLCIDATDEFGIDQVFAYITADGVDETLQLFGAGGDSFCDGYSPENEAEYQVWFVVNDSYGNVNDSVIVNFTVQKTTNITLYSPVQSELFPYGDVPLNFTISPGYGFMDKVFYQMDEEPNVILNGGQKTQGFTTSDLDGERGENNTAYANLSMSFILSEDAYILMASISLKKNGTGTPDCELQIREDDSGEPSGSVLAQGSISGDDVSSEEYSLINVTFDEAANLSAGTKYWLYLTNSSEGSADFYYWESSDDGLYAGGNYSNNESLDLLFLLYDKYRYDTSIAGLEKGIHSIIVYANSTELDMISSPQVNFTIDATSPIMSSFTYTPNDTESLDPGAILNFTINITDNLEIDKVFLQYKRENESNFSNLTAIYSSGSYRANLTPDVSGNWSVRVFANDTSGNNFYSSITYLPIYYEYGWNASPSSFNTTSSFLNTNKTIGNITINNSGSFDVSFNISKSSSTTPEVYFNGTLSSIMTTVPAGQTSKIIVIITGQSAESEDAISIMIDALNESAEPSYKQVNFTFISFVSGPYLNVEIIGYDPSVIQGQNRIGLIARITNAGNETANNVSAAWYIPGDWTEKTNLTASFTSLDAGQQVVFTRYVSIGSDAEIGNKTINISVNCSEGRNDTDSEIVEVTPLNVDEEIIVIRRGGGGGSGGGIAIPLESRINITLQEEVELERGTNTTINGTIKNTGEMVFSNLSLSLEDYPLMHYKATPDKIEKLALNESVTFELFINAPDYFGSEKLETRMTARGKVSGSSKEFSKGLTVVVFSEQKKLSAECFTSADAKLKEMNAREISVVNAEKKLTDAKKRYESKDYALAYSMCTAVIEELELAGRLKDRIASLDENYAALSVEVTELEELIVLAKEAYEKEDFLLSERRTEQAELLLRIKEQEAEKTVRYKISWIKDHLKEILILMTLSIVIGAFIYSSASLKLTNKRIKDLERRKELVKAKENETQERYFVKKSIPQRIYAKEKMHHKEELAEIEMKRNELSLKRLRIISGRAKKDLLTVKQEVEEAKAGLQRKYYVEKSLDKESYVKLLSGFDSITRELDSKMMLEEKK